MNLKLTLIVILLSWTAVLLPVDGEKCPFGGRCLPDEPCWPSDDQWQVGLSDVKEM